MSMLTLFLCLLGCASLAAADYACVCNYNVEQVVYGSPSETASPLGYMYEFDCKEHVPLSSLDSTWYAVAIEHQLGYVKENSAIQIQTCQGSPPAEDKVTTQATITTTTQPTTTTQVTTSTPKPTTTAATTSTAASTTSTTAPKPDTTTKITTPKPTTTMTTSATTTTTTPKPTTTTTTPKPTTTTTTPKPTTTTSTTQRTTTTITATPKPTTTTTTTPKPTTTTTTPKPTMTTSTPKPTTTTTPKPSTTTLKPTTSTLKATTTTPIPTMTTTPKPTTPKPTTKPTTTTPKPTTTTTTKPTTTTMTYKTTTHNIITHAPTSAYPSPSSPCYNTYRHHSSQLKGTLTNYGNNCYEFVTANATWVAAENDCSSKGGHLAHIANVQEQNFINNYLKTHYNHRVWIGLHDRQQEEHFQWSSGSPVTYTHWAPDRYNLLHVLTDCVELDPTDGGFWKDKDCYTFRQFHFGYVCQYGGSSGIQFTFTHAPTTNAPTTHAPVNHFPFIHPTVHQSGSDGNTNLCLFKQREHSRLDGTILAQYGSSCYELMPTQKMTWQHAETLCHNGGGHLAHISNTAEQAFIQGFMTRHMPNHAVWIGLHDLNREGHYEWTSGNWVSYTNFIPGHLSNYYSRFDENCFVLIPYKSGHWDDIPCGSSSFFNSDFGETHPLLCQFPTSSVSFIG